MPEQPRNIEADIAQLSFRTPVVEGDASEVDRVAVQRRWELVTEATRRAILGSNDAAQHVASYAACGLSENLPNIFLNELAIIEPNVQKAVQISGVVLKDHLGLPSVPDDLIPYGIRTQGKHYSTSEAFSELTYAADHYSVIYDGILEDIRRKAAERYLSGAEIELVADRYREARDVKLLALGAALTIEKPKPSIIDNHAIINLKSGVQIVVQADVLAADPSLMDPSKWDSRKQIKDRVYDVVVGEHHYIMKEQKTSRHTDVHSNETVGTENTVDSEREYEIGVSMAGRSHRVGDVLVTWERPVGYVRFPDGYQFCMFEKLQNAMDYKLSSISAISHEIQSRPAVYAEEYSKTLQATRDFIRVHPKLFPNINSETQMLTFSDFVSAKTEALMIQAAYELKIDALRAGYVNYDHHDFMVADPRQQDADGHVLLHFVGVDYELFIQEPLESKVALEKFEQDMTVGFLDKLINGRRSDLTLVDAASIVLYERLGWKIPMNISELRPAS